VLSDQGALSRAGRGRGRRRLGAADGRISATTAAAPASQQRTC